MENFNDKNEQFNISDSLEAELEAMEVYADDDSETANADSGKDAERDSGSAEQHERLLFAYDYDYTKAEAMEYIRTVNNKPFSMGSLILCCIIVALGLVLAIIRHTYITLVAGLMISVVLLGFPFLARLIKEWNYYSRNKSSWSCKKHIEFYESYVTMDSGLTLFDFIYDDFYKLVENDAKLYMVAGSRGVIILKKSEIPIELQEAVRKLFPN